MGNKSKHNGYQKSKQDRVEQVTTLQSLKEYGENGKIVELPAFDEDMPLIVRLKRPSMMDMISTGTIPNLLQAKAIELFEGTAKPAESPEDVSKLYELMVVFAKACLVEPTYEDFEKAGVKLTDEQLLAIYNYSQKGSRALESFRQKQATSEIIAALQEVQQSTKRDDRNKG